ncbi:hypothetical protein CDD83_9464 [Cordyceps sp. RAO-2017]|nr:hypothetical protein CDD83_9464 [Cordyceps sp. RAO-2017]
MAPADDKSASEDGLDLIPNDAVDMNTFSQILEMDEPEDHEFSHSIVFGFFDQAEETFGSMDTALGEKNLKKLADLSHFLKGSSATLGLVKVRAGCEKIERYGKKENVDGSAELDSELCLERIAEALKVVKTDYEDAERALRKYYEKSEKKQSDEAA